MEPKDGGAPNGGDGDKPGGDGGGDGDKPKLVPLSAVEEERTKRQAAEQRATELEAAEAERVRVASEEQGEFETLYKAELAKNATSDEELTGLRDWKTAREESDKARVAKRLEAIPEDKRPPGFDGLSVEQQANMLDFVEQQLGIVEPPRGTRNHTGTPPNVPSECADEAKRHGKEPVWWFKNVWNTPEQRKRRGETT